MDGVLLIDKPCGLTSHDIVGQLRRILKIKRIGHTGTLDPDATGLLVICVGKATKISNILCNVDKAYEVGFVLGVETDTYDSSGNLVSEKDVSVNRTKLSSVLESFQGQIQQKPPLYSAVKIKGKKLYEYARKGQAVELPSRTVKIHSIVLREFDGKEGMFEVTCSKGTYVRSLVHDLGQILETGAMGKNIRRLACGKFHVRDALIWDQVIEDPRARGQMEKAILPIAKALPELPRLRISDASMMPRILHGQGLRPQDMESCQWDSPNMRVSGPVLVLGDSGEALALGDFDGNASVRVRRLF